MKIQFLYLASRNREQNIPRVVKEIMKRYPVAPVK